MEITEDCFLCELVESLLVEIGVLNAHVFTLIHLFGWEKGFNFLTAWFCFILCPFPALPVYEVIYNCDVVDVPAAWRKILVRADLRQCFDWCSPWLILSVDLISCRRSVKLRVFQIKEVFVILDKAFLVFFLFFWNVLLEFIYEVDEILLSGFCYFGWDLLDSQ